MEAMEQIERALLSDPAVEDCVVRSRKTINSGLELVAYVVPGMSCSNEYLRARLESIIPADLLPRGYVLISSIPLLSSGLVDEHALAALDVIDADLIKRWQASLSSVAKADGVIVTVEEPKQHLLPLHLSDVLSRWEKIALPNGAGMTATRRNVEALPRRQFKAPAVSHGGSLRETANLPDTLQAALRRAALQSPDKGVVYVDREGSEMYQSYPALIEAAERVLSGLRRRGLNPGDKVIFQFDRNEDFVPAFWGCILGGFIPVPVSIAPSYAEINTTVSKLGNAWQLLDHPIVFTCATLAPALRSLPDLLHLEGFKVESLEDFRACEQDRNWHVSRPDDLAILLLTSGSTGIPKAVMQSHRSLLHRSAASAQMNDFTDRDVSLNWFALDHVGGIVMFHIRDVVSRCRQIQVRTDLILQQPLRWLDLIERYRVTVTWAPNFAFALVNANAEALGSRRWDLSSLRFILNGGESIVARTARRFLELLIPFGLPATAMHPAWGMSETSSGVTYSHTFSLSSTNADDPFVEVGSPIPGISVRIVDAQNNVVEEGTVGSLQIRGATVTSGYYKNPELNREAFTFDGWFKTGDLGFLHEGRLTISGREKDVVIINGANYYSHEIEAVVEEADGLVTSCTAACGVRDGEMNIDRLAVFFCPLSIEDEDLERLLKEIRGRVVRKVGINPDYLIPVEKHQIPKTSIGKIQRAEMSQRFAAGDYDAALKRVDILTRNANTLPDWFYRKIWRRREAVALLPQVPSGKFLIFLDQLGLGAYLYAELRKLNRPCVAVEAGASFAIVERDRYRINPQKPDDYRFLLKAVCENGSEVGQIIHLWSYDEHGEEVVDANEFEGFNERGIYSLLYLVQALHDAWRFGSSVSLLFVGSRTQPISSDDAVAYAKAPVIGLIKSLPQEIPWLHCRHLDLPLDSVETNGARVLRETRVLQRECEVAYRKDHRLVSRIEKFNLLGAQKNEIPFKRRGMYLICGGLGGIGVEIGKYLRQNHDARLLLIGRTPLPPRSEWGSDQKLPDGVSERIKAYLSLERFGGDLCYEAVDVCDLNEVREVVNRAQDRWQCELAGVIHLAGTYHERMVVEEARDGIERTLRPKQLGTWSLHQLLNGRNDAIFIGFSSLVSFFGGATVSAYSGANAFLDTFALCQNLKSPSRYYCFAWSAWEDVGVSRRFRMKQLLHARGYQTMTAAQAVHALLAGLQTDQRQLMVGLDGSNRNIRRYTDTPSCRLQQVTAYFSSPQRLFPRAQLHALAVQDRFGTASRCEFPEIRPLSAQGSAALKTEEKLASGDARASDFGSDFVAPRTELERQIAALWQEILVVPQAGVHEDFFQLGGDSIKAMRFVSRLRESLKLNLTVRTLFEAPTVAGLASELDAQWRDRSETLDDSLEGFTANAPGTQISLANLSDAEVEALLTQKLNERMRKP